MKYIRRILVFVALICVGTAQAQLTVIVSPVKVTGQKAVVKLEMKNNFTNKIESARAVCFLLDDQGRMVGQATRWVIGGTKARPALEPKKEATFNFIITTPQAFSSTNLTAKVSFNRLLLADNKLADPHTIVQIQNTQ
jgi:hypothetical protein